MESKETHKDLHFVPRIQRFSLEIEGKELIALEQDGSEWLHTLRLPLPLSQPCLPTKNFLLEQILTQKLAFGICLTGGGPLDDHLSSILEQNYILEQILTRKLQSAPP